ncbi:MAG: SDR family NAD(P)-dependent oxidoreductase [Candidatus Riflebacteria bacterium]|nr:SDR family NAD(P)-dependent oxidoreductase [Candidatus Riflebacteria bacterium]
MELTGNIILITGGTSGLGWGFAEEFMKLGNRVIVCGRRQERLAELKKKYPQVITRACNLNISEDREGLAAWVNGEFPQLNVLINNAGVQRESDFSQTVDLQIIRDEMETNYFAPIHLTTLLLPHLRKQKNPVIVNITSGLAFTPFARVGTYSASKAAFHSLTLSMRYQLRKTPIKVYEVIPPAVDTELGRENRKDPNQSHGGIHLDEFLREAMEGLRSHSQEIAVAGARALREKREALFSVLNPE